MVGARHGWGGFRAGIWGRAPCGGSVSGSARAPQPWPPHRREPDQPSASGTLAFVSENKVSAVTQPVAIPAIPASTFARQRGNIPAWGLPRKIPTGGTRRDGDWQHHGGRGWPWDHGSPGMGIAPWLRVGAHFASRKSPFPAWDTSNSSHQRDGWLVVPWVTKEEPEDMGTRCVTSGVSQR